MFDSELDHFVVYKLPEKPVFVSAHNKYICVSSGAYKVLGEPEYVNVFFDECRKRMMIKRADPELPNAMKIISHSGGKNMFICRKELAGIVIGMFGESVHVPGHKVGDGSVVFEMEGK